MRTGYAELFHVYPEAWQQPDSDLESFFATRTSAGKQVIEKTVSTFKSLVALADFQASPPATEEGTVIIEPATGNVRVPINMKQVQSPSPSLHIDIQIHIASDASTDQIDQIFASMAKHLYKT